MRIGDVIEADVDGSGMNGEGVAHVDGFAVFIPYTLIGERVRAKLTLVKKSFAVGKVIKLLKQSPKRVNPICPQFFNCGGCDLMHINQELHKKIKRDNVINTLRKTAHIQPKVDETVCVGDALYYRNKVQLPIGLIDGKVTLGYYKEGTHTLVPFSKCYLHGEWADKIIDCFVRFANSNRLSVYNEKTGKGLLRHLVMRNLNGAICIVVVVNGDKLPNYDRLITELAKHFEGFSLFININTRSTNVIVSDNYIRLFGKNTIDFQLCNVKCELSPKSFMQVNTAVAERIYSDVEKVIADMGSVNVIEGYSGIGILSNILAGKAKSVTCVEIVPEAVANADYTAKLNNNSEKIRNICADAAVELPKLINSLGGRVHEMRLYDNYLEAIIDGNNEHELRLNDSKRQQVKVGDRIRFTGVQGGKTVVVEVTSRGEYHSFAQTFDNNADFFRGVDRDEWIKSCYDIYTHEQEEELGAVIFGLKLLDIETQSKVAVVLDPPRKGCDAGIIDALINTPPDKILYISCNPATLARDISALAQTFEVSRVTPYDMFPMTKHIETLVCLSRKQ